LKTEAELAAISELRKVLEGRKPFKVDRGEQIGDMTIVVAKWYGTGKTGVDVEAQYRQTAEYRSWTLHICGEGFTLDREWLRAADPSTAAWLDKRDAILAEGGVYIGSNEESHGGYSLLQDDSVRVATDSYRMPDGTVQTLSHSIGRD
jgi:hypothetical protein